MTFFYIDFSEVVYVTNWLMLKDESTLAVVLPVCIQDSVCITWSRFTGNGWQAAEATDMMTVYNSLPAADIQRLVLSLCVVKPVSVYYL